MKKYTLYIISTLILLASPAFSQTIYVSGDITTNTTWAADTVKITDNVYVNDTVTLTINPGTYVEFQGPYNIYIMGRLLAVGSINDSITFTINDTTGFSIDTSAAGAWNGIWVQTSANADTSLICYCNFSFCKGAAAILLSGSKTKIENNSFEFIQNGIRLLNSCYSNIRFNIIKNCLYNGVECGTNNYVLISSNNITNTGTGIFSYTHAEIEENIILNCSFGIVLYDSNSTVIHNEIKNNFTGILLNDSNSFISENIISNNDAGIDCTNSSPIINNNEISNNKTGIRVNTTSSTVHSNPLIIFNRICNNHATGGCSTEGGSAMYCGHSSPLIINNIIANNRSDYLGIISFVDSSDALIINNTIVNNFSFTGEGISVFSSKLKMANNILWGNLSLNGGPHLFLFSTQDSVSEIMNCCIQDTTNSNISNVSVFQNNILNDPLFVNPSAGAGNGYDGLAADWSLQPISPCIDAGTSDTSGLHLKSIDIAGNNRILGGKIDIGAYESFKDTITSQFSSFGEFGFFVYPNPAKDYINLIILNALKRSLQLSITDISGKTLYVENNTNNDLYYNKAINLTSFPKGVYVMSISYENGKAISKTLIKE